MQKGTQLILKGLAVLSLLYFTGYLLWGFLGVHDVADPHGLNVNNGTMLDHSPEPPQGSVVLLTALTANKLDVFNGIDDFYGKVWTNRQQYARLHGYEAMILDLNSFPISKERHAVWGKLPAIMHAMETHPSAEWVWWLDIDALIMTSSIDLYDHLLSPEVLRTRLLEGNVLIADPAILGPNYTVLTTGETMDPDEIDFICVQDANGLNAGSFFIRNSPTGKLILDLWTEKILVDYSNEHWHLREQALLHHLLYHHHILRRRFGWVNQTLINAYPLNWEGDAWQPGDLVVHFPNCWMIGNCVPVFNYYWDAMERPNGTEADEESTPLAHIPVSTVEPTEVETLRESQPEVPVDPEPLDDGVL